MAEKSRYRNRDFHLHLFEEEWIILEQKSKEQGVSKSEFLRDFILYGKPDVTRNEILSDQNFKMLLYELNRIGNNVNQIAYNSNLKKSTGKEEIEELKKKYDDILSLFADTFLYPDGDIEYGYDEES